MTPVTYCVLPAGSEPEVVAAVRRQYAADPKVVVVVDERAAEEEQSPEVLRQRRPILQVGVPEGSAPGVRHEQHLPPVDVLMADQSLEWVIAHAVELDPAASTEFRWRAYALVLVLLTDRLGNRTAAHRSVPKVLAAVQAALPSYRVGSDFQRWLISLIGGMALDT